MIILIHFLNCTFYTFEYSSRCFSLSTLRCQQQHLNIQIWKLNNNNNNKIGTKKQVNQHKKGAFKTWNFFYVNLVMFSPSLGLALRWSAWGWLRSNLCLVCGRMGRYPPLCGASCPEEDWGALCCCTDLWTEAWGFVWEVVLLPNDRDTEVSDPEVLHSVLFVLIRNNKIQFYEEIKEQISRTLRVFFSLSLNLAKTNIRGKVYNNEVLCNNSDIMILIIKF